jgi:hypothetical protein
MDSTKGRLDECTIVNGGRWGWMILCGIPKRGFQLGAMPKEYGRRAYSIFGQCLQPHQAGCYLLAGE